MMLRRKLLILASLTALVASLSAAAVAYPVTISIPPHIVTSLGASVSPQKLPTGKYAPVTWDLFGKFATNDGAHLPALRELELDIDKDVRLTTKGYPVCRVGRLDIRDPNPQKAAMEACRPALLGKGEAHVEIAFTEQEPVLVKSPLTVFNGGEKGGKVKLLIHIFITVPVPAAVVTEVTIVRKGSGVHTVSKVPVIARGSGSLVDFKFRLGKTYSYKGKKVGYFEAKCPDGVFKAGVKRLLFKNETHTPGEGASTQLAGSLAVPCTSEH